MLKNTWLIGVAVACLAMTGAPLARAEPSQDSAGEVYAALEVAREPADYVLIVDTSGSMRQERRYPRVLSALKSLLQSLEPYDRVSLVTFDTVATVRFRGAIGKTPLAALAKLPAKPTGRRTDIGAGIAAGIAELEKADARQAGAIALVTDGKLDTEAGSDYAKPGNTAWEKLRQRADSLAGRGKIASYALSLDSDTDAALLKRAFPEAEVIPVTKIDERFAELDSSVLNFQAAQIIREDLAHGVTASFAIDLTTLAPTGGTIPTTLKFASSYARVPVVLSDLTFASSGTTLGLTGLPDEIVLAPGEQKELPVTLTHQGSGSGVARIAGNFTSPWRAVITQDLKLDLAPSLALELPTATTPPTVGVPALPPAGLLGLGVIALLGLVALGRRLFRAPDLVGSLRVSGPDGTENLLLAGRAQQLPAGPGLVIHATGVWGKTPSIRVDARLGGARTRGVLADGEELEIGDYRLHYTSARTRMIELIESHNPGAANQP